MDCVLHFNNENSGCYEKHREYNLVFIKHMEAFLNQKLNLKGYITLEEIKERLGFDTCIDDLRFGFRKDDDPMVFINLYVNPKGTNPKVVINILDVMELF